MHVYASIVSAFIFFDRPSSRPFETKHLFVGWKQLEMPARAGVVVSRFEEKN